LSKPMSRNALRLYKTAEFVRIDVKISLTNSRYVLFHHPILHAVAWLLFTISFSFFSLNGMIQHP
ncbi:MAG TPA: hypothetical protein PK299_10880, partial [Anaerolineales bacterium]|nr:hypothetical protein [Anaerolineales bacterium]